MMRNLKAYFLIILMAVSTKIAMGQGGGPPMLTDDPGVVDLHKFELNTPITLQISDVTEIAFPYVDLNYGIAKNLQLKLEVPFIFDVAKHTRIAGRFNDISVGMKFRFLDEEKSFISAAVYPQFTLVGDKGLLFPLLLEKTFGKFLIGNASGIWLGTFTAFQNGILVGFKPGDHSDIMAEYFLEKEFGSANRHEGYLNFGFRQRLTQALTLMGSFGTQISTPEDTQRVYFISYVGLQSSF